MGPTHPSSCGSYLFNSRCVPRLAPTRRWCHQKAMLQLVCCPPAPLTNPHQPCAWKKDSSLPIDALAPADPFQEPGYPDPSPSAPTETRASAPVPFQTSVHMRFSTRRTPSPSSLEACTRSPVDNISTPQARAPSPAIIGPSAVPSSVQSPRRRAAPTSSETLPGLSSLFETISLLLRVTPSRSRGNSVCPLQQRVRVVRAWRNKLSRSMAQLSLPSC